MERLGRMTDAGRAVLPDMSEQEFVIDSTILEALQADEMIWESFQKFPSLYQRVRIDTIQIKKKQPELFKSCLQKLLDNTKANVNKSSLLYNFINDAPVSEPAVLRHLLKHLILCWFRLFLRKWHKIPAGEFVHLTQTETPARFLSDIYKTPCPGMAAVSLHSMKC